MPRRQAWRSDIRHWRPIGAATILRRLRAVGLTRSLCRRQPIRLLARLLTQFCSALANAEPNVVKPATFFFGTQRIDSFDLIGHIWDQRNVLKLARGWFLESLLRDMMHHLSRRAAPGCAAVVLAVLAGNARRGSTAYPIPFILP